MLFDLLALIGRDTTLKRTGAGHGGEYAGPCPLCRRGADRFRVWPQLGRWACLGPAAGRAGCDIGGDAVAYLRRRHGLSYTAACESLGIEAGAGYGGAALARSRPPPPSPSPRPTPPGRRTAAPSSPAARRTCGATKGARP